MSKEEFFKFNVGHLIQLITFIAAASIVYGQLKADDLHRDAKLSTLESRIEKMEQAVSDMAVVKNDVLWIKEYLKNQNQTKNGR